MADKIVTAADVAKWMWDEIRKAGDLDQQAAAIIAHKDFGERFTYITDKGRLGLSDAVKAEFKKLHKRTAKYSSRNGRGRWILEQAG